MRVGNGAYDQLQLDIYGELMDSVYLYNKYGSPISYKLWTQLARLVDWVCDNWQREDEGVWEVRGGKRHFVYSKLMSWVAVERGLRLADKRSFPADRDRWLKCRDQIFQEIMAKGWNEERGAFVQYYGGDTLDAANLMMPLVFFISPTDPRMLSTLDVLNRSPESGGLVSNSLVYRYNLERSPRRAGRVRGDLQRMHLLAHRGLDSRGSDTGGAAHVRADAGLWQPPGALRRGDRARAARLWATSRRPSPTWRS